MYVGVFMYNEERGLLLKEFRDIHNENINSLEGKIGIKSDRRNIEEDKTDLQATSYKEGFKLRLFCAIVLFVGYIVLSNYSENKIIDEMVAYIECDKSFSELLKTADNDTVTAYKVVKEWYNGLDD